MNYGVSLEWRNAITEICDEYDERMFLPSKTHANIESESWGDTESNPKKRTFPQRESKNGFTTKGKCDYILYR